MSEDTNKDNGVYIDMEYAIKNGLKTPITCTADGVVVQCVMSINKKLGMISVINDSGTLHHATPSKLTALDANGKIVVEW